MGKHCLILICFLVLVFNAWPETYIIDFLYETVEVKEGNSWVEMDIGDTIAADAVIRLSHNGSLELKVKNSTIAINGDGTYVIKDLIESSQAVSAWGLDTILTAKLSAISGKKKHAAEVASQGVRADNPEEPDFDFLDYETYMELGMQALEAGQYKLAIEHFTNGKDNALEKSEESRAAYNLARAYMGNEQFILSQMELMNLEVSPEDDYYPGYVILQGNLYLKTAAFKEANELFGEYLQNVDKKLTWDHQTITFLSSICYRALNELPQARAALKETVNLDPASLIGQTAAGILQDLQ